MRLAFILPRYGPQVMGGAETLARGVVERLAQRGHHLEVWTTCVQNIYTWANTYPAGVTQCEAVTLRRFPVEVQRRHDLLTEPLSLENQYLWADNLPYSPQLNAHIAEHGSTFDFLIFIPYVMGTTLRGAPLHPHNSIIWPCLHDEIWAYMAPTRAILSGAVGVIFNTAAEQQLMEQKLHIRHPHTVIAGMGFDSPAGDAAAFRQKYPQLDEPFFVYAGRLDASKNVDLLHLYFLKYQSRHHRPLNLALLGDGPLARHDLKGIFTLGFVDEATKRNALAAAAFLCQPSLYESFSVVLMEAWAQGRPTLVHEHCPVTVNHVREAQGGLYFANYNDFEGAIDYLLAHPDQANQMGANGQAYVRRHYNWPLLIDRLEQALLNWQEK